MTGVLESLLFATMELVRSTPLKQRLVCAYRRHLISINPDDLPADVRDSFRQVMKSLQGVAPQPGENPVVASVRKMSVQEAEECAGSVVEIFGITARAHFSVVLPAVEVSRA
jgi:hypothetical protein